MFNPEIKKKIEREGETKTLSVGNMPVAAFAFAAGADDDDDETSKGTAESRDLFRN